MERGNRAKYEGGRYKLRDPVSTHYTFSLNLTPSRESSVTLGTTSINKGNFIIIEKTLFDRKERAKTRRSKKEKEKWLGAPYLPTSCKCRKCALFSVTCASRTHFSCQKLPNATQQDVHSVFKIEICRKSWVFGALLFRIMWECWVERIIYPFCKGLAWEQHFAFSPEYIFRAYKFWL